MDIKEHLQAWSISFLIKNRMRNKGAKASVNEKLAKELHKPMIKKCKRRKVYAKFKDNIWTVDLAEMG